MNPFVQLVSITLFRGKAENLPSSYQWVVITVIAAVGTSFLNRQFANAGSNLLVMAIVEVSIYSAFIYLMLKVNQKSERFLQVITGILGANAIIQLVAAPLFSTGGVNLEELSLLTTLGLLLVSAWSFAISVIILRDALELRLGPAILITFGCQAATLVGLLMFFPMTGSAG